MTLKQFLSKFKSLYLWGNLLAMAVVVVLLLVGVWFGLGIYTHHGERITVPDLQGMQFEKALRLLEADGLGLAVSDSGYNKKLPANSILGQNPTAGNTVKAGRTIYVTVNSPSSPAVSIPDLVENCSFREAMAKLTALGFRLKEPRRIVGEKDWVYGIEADGRSLNVGEMVSIETPLTLVIGSGTYDEDDPDITYTDDDDFDPMMGDMTPIDTDPDF